jgi:ABC-2 type transport system permease protein
VSAFASGGSLERVWEVARRSFLRTMRQPGTLFPSMVFPLFLLAVNTAGLNATTDIPGFPTDSYLTFALAIPFIQGGIFALLNAGTDLATDIETGFLNRLALTPLGGAALLAGTLGGALAVGLVQAGVYIAVGFAAGADFAAGVGGIPVLIALSVAISFALGCVGTFCALRVGSGEAMQSLFPIFFVFLFFSAMAMPRNLIEQDWFRTIADVNPVSYLIEGIRSLYVTGWDGEALALAVGISAIVATIFLTASAVSLRTRLVRT